MTLYCIPGLGADEKLFRNFQPEGYELHFIKWVVPRVEDSLGSYSERLLDQIDQSQPFAILGVSLGGMLAIELAARCRPEKVFIVSSVKSSEEFPAFLALAKYLRFLISYPLLKAAKPFIELLFGKLNATDRRLIFEMIDSSDKHFMVWAAKAILTWKSPPVAGLNGEIIHILGDKDMIFKYSSLKDLLVVKGGTHLMILNRADEIARAVENGYGL